MKILFDTDAKNDKDTLEQVNHFLTQIQTNEQKNDSTINIYQDGSNGSYFIKCSIPANTICNLIDLDARLDPNSSSSYRSNRNLLLKHHTYQKMKSDAEKGREFHDIIVEYSIAYTPEKPLKVWGGQHRSKAIQEAYTSTGT